jgi:hypothetical protein
LAKLDIGPDFDAYMKQLEKFGIDEPEVAKRVVMAGAQPVADAIRRELEKTPEDNFRQLKENEKFEGIPKSQKKDLLDSLGITPPGVDREGNTNAKVGWNGYGSYKSKKYPRGLPNALLARVIESGSSVRIKTPFVRTATNKSKPKAIDEMQQTINEEANKYNL